VYVLTGTMSALQRHQQQVQHILKQGYVTAMDMDGDNGEGFSPAPA
jgi:ribulose bisphosphate carboxylase small subunit